MANVTDLQTKYSKLAQEYSKVKQKNAQVSHVLSLLKTVINVKLLTSLETLKRPFNTLFDLSPCTCTQCYIGNICTHRRERS